MAPIDSSLKVAYSNVSSVFEFSVFEFSVFRTQRSCDIAGNVTVLPISGGSKIPPVAHATV